MFSSINLLKPHVGASKNPGLPEVKHGLSVRFSTEGRMVKSRLSIPAILGTLIAMQSSVAAYAVPGAKQTRVLERVDVNGTNREMGMGVSEFPPDAEKPRHMATGPEVCYAARGEIILRVQGQLMKMIRAGGSFQIAANAIHVTKAGPAGATVIATWVSTPGKPFNASVPQ
jgi:quercetin dioxygenase-like cupin family protein